ncbi:unnamed protein product [Eruca vesicaria subsp. sativa]|uniref:Uncharacterized protein n=1 Tax=Eruca vesicaria subsp. sativa TaxID=29727 RepID=A0ABC8JS78_ERUVS|nr:unnamed protein product [Eruca vesicaria subsp. sativa]
MSLSLLSSHRHDVLPNLSPTLKDSSPFLTVTFHLLPAVHQTSPSRATPLHLHLRFQEARRYCLEADIPLGCGFRSCLSPDLRLPCCHCFCTSTLVLLGQYMDWKGWSDSLSILFKGSTFWYKFTYVSVTDIKIVIPTVVVVPITGIKSLNVFIMFLGVIPLLRPNVVEI